MSSQEVCTPATAAIQEDDSHNKAICKLCRRQFAKYTCPSCNVPYCSLVCFRSPSHSECSETFYKNELQSHIATTPSHTHEERKQMMELLRRFEEEAAQDEDILYKEASGTGDKENEGTDREEALVDRFAGLDLNSLSSEDMWEMLTPEERKKFVKALEDPTSELAQTLLTSEQLEVEIEQPWWIDSAEDLDREHPNQGISGHRGIELRPKPIRISQSMIKPVPPGHPLVYNLLAICVAYSYIVRHLGTRMLSALAPTNPDFQEALRLIDVLVPFLLDHRSTTLHHSVGAAVTGVYSRFEMGKVNPELLAVLLVDTATLMRPLRVVPVPPQPDESGGTSLVDLSAHTLLMPIHVLSDMVVLFQSGQEEERRVPFEASSQNAPGQSRSKIQSGTKSKTKLLSRYNHVIRKLEFYVAHVLATPSGIMENVSNAVLSWSQRVQAEGRSIMNKNYRVAKVQESHKQLVEENVDER